MIINTANANLLPTQKSFCNSRSSFHGCCVFNFIASTNTTSNLKPPKSRVLVRASAADNGGKSGYKRIPMDTAGAYQLIDEESGQKVIVWGGCGDDDVTVPSKDVLSWTPTEKKSISALKNTSSDEGSEVVSAASRSDSPTIRIGRNFGRLKTQRVRVLANKTSSSIEQKERNDYGDNLVVKKKKSPRSIYDRDSNSGREYREPKVNLFNEFNEDTNPNVWLRKDMDHPGDTSGKHAEQPQQYSAEARTYETKLPASVSKKSAAFFSKWGDGESTHSFRTEAMGSQLRTRKPSTENGFFSRKSFLDVGCSDYMIESLRGQGFLRPSHIQAMAFAHVVEGKSCIISDQSGSGKTLAYLVPVIQRLRQEELQGVSKSLSKSPRVIILVPTAELASQVLTNCRSISKSGVPFRSMVVTGGFKQKTQLESLRQELDVLIATPGRFLFLLKERFLHLENIRCVVLDEVDILVRDEDFDQALQSFINSSPVTTQYLFVTATLPTDAYNKLVEVFPDCEAIMGPSMHRTSIGLEEVLVDCSGDYEAEKNPETAFLNKKNALLRLVEGSSVSKTIIFCNKIETCRKVENILTRYDRKGYHMRVLSFHAALTQESRLANMTEFLKSHSEKEALFLICTDRASRGIDFAGVDHVILFDFPRDPSEYVRRVGRTARGAGGKGTAYVFVVGKQVSLARRIMERNQKGQPLHDVPCMY